MKTVKKECFIEFEEKKSKFIGYVKPVSSREEAEKFIEKIKQKHYDATHNCSAYKLTENGQEYFKVDDDGEPKGTAGKPMGDIINYMEVENLVVIATRYFGGIKLGAGGLVRAYAKTAKLAIQESEIVDYIEKKTYLLDFSYDKVGEVEQIILKNNDDILEKGYNDKVTYKVILSKKSIEELENKKDISIIII
ncbi:MAG: YigZ family protein [Fusobacterium perfoetens]|uniref:YigZ family protein n=1 Tax=Fusobacterium perfoetens TaxID=852 RepID=UPI0023F0BDBE|nr:YigZ family protein [Fusobacterium perfoetens]MCI6153296.1 YigZ family protein [Fusobacterium perfoetens]MDY3237814.1 YigZ family protein [Fusobacterium perfoetens]